MSTQVLGIIGETPGVGTEFIYDLITPDFSQQPNYLFIRNFTDENDYPTSAGIFDQRRVLISTNDGPNTVFFSAIGRFNNFLVSADDDEAFQLILDSQYFDPIHDAVSSQFGMLLFSERGVFLILSGTGTGITANNAIAKQELASGAKTDVPPLVVLKDVVYISNLDNTPRILSPVNTTPNQFNTNDIALYSRHLFKSSHGYIEETIASQLTTQGRDGMELRSWTYAGRNDRIIWAVRADGVLLSCTFAPEHGVVAWCKHTTKGRFRDVQAVYEGDQDTVYMVVERGQHKFVEALARQETTLLANSVPVDCAVKTENFSTIGRAETVLRIKRYADGQWVDRPDTDQPLVDNIAIESINYSGLVAQIDSTNAISFSASDIGNWIKTPGGVYEISESGIIDNRTVLIHALLDEELDIKGTEYFEEDPNNELITSPQNDDYVIGSASRQPIYHWELVFRNAVYNVHQFRQQAVTRVSGLRNVSTGVFTRFVQGINLISTENAEDRGLTVGFPFKATLHTLPFINQEFTQDNKPIRINNISLRCFQSAAVRAGKYNSSLYPLFFDDTGRAERALKTGIFKMPLGTDWSVDSNLVIESQLPFTILGVIVSYDVGQLENQRARTPLR